MRPNLRPFLFIIAALVAGCRPQAPAARPATTDPAAEERFSVYDLGSRWRDASGAERALGSLAGGPRVVAMVYTHCASTCPLSIAAMKRIEAATPPGVGLVLVSLDPERDTPDRLASFARESMLTGPRWTLLAGSDADTRALAAALGVRYRRLSATELAHSNTLTLLDAEGAVVLQRQGLDGADDVLAAARSLSATH